MKKKVLITIVVVILLALALIFGWFSLTGEVTSYRSVEKDGLKCEDSDGGVDFEDALFVKGRITQINVEARNYTRLYEDECAGSNKILEYYCTAGGYVESARRRCFNGCSEGACVRE